MTWSSSRHLSPALKCAIVLRGAHLCVWCDRLLRRRKDHQIDHVKPRAHGGSSTARNLVLACPECNSARGDDRQSFGAYLRARGKSLAAALRRVREQLRAPIDLVAGRELADRWYPGLYERRAAREARRRARLRDPMGLRAGTWFDPVALEAVHAA